jgi:uncharacterized repeat protein (TIGR01451 family)
MRFVYSNLRTLCRSLSKVLLRSISLFLTGLILILSLNSPTIAAPIPFTPRFQTNDTGDIIFVGNTLMSCATATANCPAARNGTYTGGQNNGFAMSYVDVDSDSNTFNSSSADMNLPAGAQVLFAGLYWAGDSSNAARNQAKLATPGSSSYITLTANASDIYSNIGYQNAYQAFSNITSIIQAKGNGTYTVANVQSTSGSTNRWAGWTIVVVYRSPGEPARNLTVFDGFNVVSSTNTTINIPISGFTTPPFGTIYAKLGAIAYDGDDGVGVTGSSYTGDRFKFNGVDLGDASNPTNDVFNSSITYLGTPVATKFPNYRNQFGYDSDVFNVSGLLNNNQTTATLTLNTGGETFMPGVITSAIQIFAPVMNINKSVTDLNGGDAEPGDILEYTITVLNDRDSQGNGDVAINSLMVDTIPENVTFVSGSLEIDGVSKTDAIADDEVDFDAATRKITYRLGAGATATQGGRLEINPTSGYSTTVKFKVTVDAGTANGAVIVNQSTASFEAENLPGTILSGSSNASSIVVKALPSSTPPQVLLIKRITAINNTQFNETIDDPGSTNDNAANWTLPIDTDSGISSYLRGKIVGGTVKPGDIVEYTIYFLSTGGRDAANVSICDLVPKNSTFIPDAFSGLAPTDNGLPGDSGIALSFGSTTPTAYLTNQVDTPDRGYFIPSGTSVPASCIGTNTNGAIIVEIAKNPVVLSKATGPGTPTNSYGFIRFRANVN